MGFSQVAAAAIVLTAGSVAAFTLAGRAFDATGDMHDAWSSAVERDLARLHSALAVESVTEDLVLNTYTVSVRNTGTTTLDASDVDLLANGLPVTVSTRTVEGSISDVWPPATVLTLVASGAAPADVAVASGTGALAFWRV